MTYTITVLQGDGIGPEVTGESIKLIDKIAQIHNLDIKYNHCLIGGAAIDKTGVPLPDETIEYCKNSDATLLGAVGGPKWDNLPSDIRPEKGLLKIRKALGLYANIRPAILMPALKDASPLKPSITEKGINITVVRELTGGIYFGEKKRFEENGQQAASDTEKYNTEEITRITKTAFELAQKSRKKVTLVDKANVLESSKLWREIVKEIAKDYPDTELDFMYVDNAAMQLVKNPAQFDILLTNNIFGDILSDEAAMITGSIGILPSSSLGETTNGLYEPIHGSAPDIAGKNIANPIASILSVAMMFRYTFNRSDIADQIENAVNKTLEQGYRTADLSSENPITCSEMGEKIRENL